MIIFQSFLVGGGGGFFGFDFGTFYLGKNSKVVCSVTWHLSGRAHTEAFWFVASLSFQKDVTFCQHIHAWTSEAINMYTPVRCSTTKLLGDLE